MTNNRRALWILLTAGALVLAFGVFIFRADKKEALLEGNGEVVQEPLPLESYHGIEAGGLFHIVLSNDHPETLLETHSNLLGAVKAEVRDGILHLKIGGAMANGSHLKVYLPVTQLESIDLDGMARLESDVPLAAESMRIKLSGMADVNLELGLLKLDADCSGASALTLRGHAEELSLECSGTSKINTVDLMARQAQVKASGTSEIDLRVGERLSGSCSGSSQVRYWGGPELDIKTSGTASVKGME